MTKFLLKYDKMDKRQLNVFIYLSANRYKKASL